MFGEDTFDWAKRLGSVQTNRTYYNTPQTRFASIFIYISVVAFIFYEIVFKFLSDPSFTIQDQQKVHPKPLDFRFEHESFVNQVNVSLEAFDGKIPLKNYDYGHIFQWGFTHPVHCDINNSTLQNCQSICPNRTIDSRGVSLDYFVNYNLLTFIKAYMVEVSARRFGNREWKKPCFIEFNADQNHAIYQKTLMELFLHVEIEEANLNNKGGFPRVTLNLQHSLPTDTREGYIFIDEGIFMTSAWNGDMSLEAKFTQMIIERIDQWGRRIDKKVLYKLDSYTTSYNQNEVKLFIDNTMEQEEWQGNSTVKTCSINVSFLLNNVQLHRQIRLRTFTDAIAHVSAFVTFLLAFQYIAVYYNQMRFLQQQKKNNDSETAGFLSSSFNDDSNCEFSLASGVIIQSKNA